MSSASSCSRLKGKARPRGATPLRWIDLVTRDLDGIQDWREAVHNQPLWRKALTPPYILIRDKGKEWNVCV